MLAAWRLWTRPRAEENVIVILHPPTQRVLTLIPTMEMEAILAKMVSRRIA